MAKTKFVNGQTPVTSEFLNSMYGGDPAATGVERTGHTHDGSTDDGSAAKVDLS